MPKNHELFVDESDLGLLRERNPEFLGKLFLEVNPYLLKVCGANGFFREKAEDLVHQTWEVFFSGIEKFKAQSKISTYLCGILYHKMQETWRKDGKTVFEEDLEKVVESSFAIKGWWNRESHPPQKLLELKQAGIHIQECLEGLTPQQKMAFLLREVEDEVPEEICTALEVEVSHLRVILFRAKEKLRKCLEGKV